jgi:hypothetical protein
MEIRNWILKKHFDNITVLSMDFMPFYTDYLRKKHVLVNNDLSKSSTFINWNLYAQRFTFFYDYESSEKEIKEWLLTSPLVTRSNVSMDFGYGNPVIQIKTNYFIDHWYEFTTGAHFESTVVSDDGCCIMEFTKQYDLISNFRIKQVPE